MSFDYSEFTKFLKSVEGAVKSHESFFNRFLIDTALRALAKTKERTPVKSGHLRNNFKLTGVTKEGNKLYIELYNSVGYASYVESGHRRKGGIFIPELGKKTTKGWTEGYYMVEISLMEINREMPERYKEEFSKYLKKFGVGD